MAIKQLLAAVAGCGLVMACGCKTTNLTTPNYTAALNSYYAAYPACLWTSPVKFPVQADASDSTKTGPYDALVDQGLLVRTTGEKKELLVFNKRVTNYDLSAKGRGAWTPDAQQPGMGNFCYGKPTVTSIDANSTTVTNGNVTATVNYHVMVTGAPAWASAPETENAFPGVRDALSGPTAAVATLANNGNGLQVTQGPAQRPGGPANNANGTLVQ